MVADFANMAPKQQPSYALCETGGFHGSNLMLRLAASLRWQFARHVRENAEAEIMLNHLVGDGLPKVSGFRQRDHVDLDALFKYRADESCQWSRWRHCWPWKSAS